MWSADGRFIYYVSDCCGTPETPDGCEHRPARRSRQGACHKPSPFTRTTRSAVRGSAPTENGSSTNAAPTCGSFRRRKATRGSWRSRSTPTTKSNTERIATFTRGATEFAVSPDEKHVASSSSTARSSSCRSWAAKATRLTDSPAFDHGITWSPDSRKIVFASDRAAKRTLYLLESDDPTIRDLTGAHQFKVKQLTDTPEAEVDVSFSPDGKPRRVSPSRQALDHEPRRQRPEDRGRRRCKSSTTTGRRTPSGLSTPAATAHSPASCTSSPAERTAARRKPGPQRHALRHLQRRRLLEPEREQAGVHQPTPATADDVGTFAQETGGARNVRRQSHRNRLGRCPPQSKAAFPFLLKKAQFRRTAGESPSGRRPQAATTFGWPTATAGICFV